MALRRPELPSADLVTGPCGVRYVAMAIDTEQLEGGVAHTHPARFPVADSPKTDAQEFGCILPTQSGENSFLTKLPGVDQLDSGLFPKTPATLSSQGVLYIM